MHWVERELQAYIFFLAGPLVETEYKVVAVFGFLERRHDDVVAVGLQEGMFGLQRSFVFFRLHGERFVIQIVALADSEGLLPRSAVRIERVGELVMAFVGVRVGPRGGTKERKPQHVAFGVVAAFTVVQE